MSSSWVCFSFESVPCVYKRQEIPRMTLSQQCHHYVADVLLACLDAWWEHSHSKALEWVSVVVVSALVWQHVIVLGSSRIPLQSVMSVVGQLICVPGQAEKMGTRGLIPQR